MAEIVSGIGTAHTPQLHTLAKDWHIRANRDRVNGIELWYHGKRYLWDDLYEDRKNDGYDDPEILKLDEGERRLKTCFEAIDTLAAKYEEVKPDLAIICGNDQHEFYVDDIQPAFTIIAAEVLENMPRTDEQKKRLPPGIEISDHGHIPPTHMTFPGAPELANHVTVALSNNDFDVTFAASIPHADPDKAMTSGMPHAFGWIYRNIMQDNPIPNLPLVINTFFPPNRPSARRCYEFGRQVGLAVQNWEDDARVLVAASGGLSHFVIDEEFDRDFLKGLEDNDLDRFFELEDSWYRAGNSECKNWLMAAGIMSVTALNMRTVEYQTLPRTEAGTGSTCAFAIWE